MTLLQYLRDVEGIISVKDGCSGQGACGACLVEMNGKPALSCKTRMKKAAHARIVTIEGFEPGLKELLGKAFVKKGAVQCGFCTPGFISRTRLLLTENADPSREQVVKALGFNLCRCTGYVKIVDAVLCAARKIRHGQGIALPGPGGLGQEVPKYMAYERAVGESGFTADLKFDGMLYGALKFSDHPRARVLNIDCREAAKLSGVVRVFTAKDIPGRRHTGIIVRDWPVMVREGEVTRYVGDVLAGVAAVDEKTAREAVRMISVEYEVMEALTDMTRAGKSPVKVHETGNLLYEVAYQRGENPDQVIQDSDFVVSRTYRTQPVDHGYLETEAAVALPEGRDAVRVYVQSQAVYEDRREIARILGLPEEKVIITLVPCGGAFGGKEDLTVQAHAAVFCRHLGKPVMVRLSREESIRMHPKKHPMILEYTLGCDRNGMLTGLSARITGDAGAYASLSAQVLDRAAGHATGAFHVPSVDVRARAYYTNNIPCGAMRGFGVNQATFAMEGAVDELCETGGFDPWQFRYDNALKEGSRTATGQVLTQGVGLRETLLAVKDDFKNARYAGIAMGLKNVGYGNGIPDESEVEIEITEGPAIVIHHGWTEMGQGVDTVAVQMMYEATGIDDAVEVRVICSTDSEAHGGATTASRGTFLLGNAIIRAARALKEDLKTHSLYELQGKKYKGKWICDWTNKPGTREETVTHMAYGYATQVVILDEAGMVRKVVAAHDGGRVINPLMFEGQIEGAVVMGLGYALSENVRLEHGYPKNSKLAGLGIPRIKQTPQIIVKSVEVRDPVGPFGAKGIGEIGCVPTAAAVAGALYRFDKVRRFELPMKKGKKS